MENEITSRKGTARLAGLLYLLWILTGLYAMFYIPSQIDLKGDAATAAQNIIAKEFLYRTGIMNSLVSSTIWVFMVLVFYRLFKPVDARLVKLLVALVIVQIPVGFVMETLSITSLMIFKGEVLKSFELAQRQDVAMLFLKINEYAVSTLVLFWGLWLFPLGMLTYKSGFLPRFLGVWLLVNGVVFLILSVMHILFPEYKDLIFKFGFPAMLGEVVFMLWLLIMGAKNEPVNDVPV